MAKRQTKKKKAAKKGAAKKRATKKSALYFGKAGHLNVMSELLLLGYNVGMPEVDVGDDIFVVHDLKAGLTRVQVKSATGKKKSSDNSLSGLFSLATRYLKGDAPERTVYIFVFRHNNSWPHYVLMEHEKLKDLYEGNKLGKSNNGKLMFTFKIANDKLYVSGKDISEYLNKWDYFSKIIH